MNVDLNALPCLLSFLLVSCEQRALIFGMAGLAFYVTSCYHYNKVVCVHVVPDKATSSSNPVTFFCVWILHWLFFSYCFSLFVLSKTLAKGVERLVHYFRDTAWYSNACLFLKTPSSPWFLCLHALWCSNNFIAYSHKCFHLQDFPKNLSSSLPFILSSLFDSFLCFSKK